MSVITIIKKLAREAIGKLYGFSFEEETFLVNETKPEFEGDYTLVLFPLLKQLKLPPDQLGTALGEFFLSTDTVFSGFNVIKGFLNLTLRDTYWVDFLNKNYPNAFYGKMQPSGKKVMVEYSSPNTNKPLHLGHLRNNFLGWSLAEIQNANGMESIKTCIVNDRGIHICKSMLAWQKNANGATPASTGIKGDHFVGEYYVLFENELRAQAAPILDRVKIGTLTDFEGNELTEIKKLIAARTNTTEPEKLKKIDEEIQEIVRNHAPVMQEAKKMLRDWEAGNPAVIELWKKMNGWVYEGFAETYRRIGIEFDRIYYESETYLLGRDTVQKGLGQGVFFKKEDGSVWIDLTTEGLDEKLVMRKDGTSVYITQDIGLAEQKYNEYKPGESIYVVGDEQNYHFKVLKLIARKLQLPGSDTLFHLSYGMVELPGGRMKSREGTVVDADDMVDEMVSIAARHTEELGKVKDFEKPELEELYQIIGLGALKFYLLRVDPKKRMIFNPEESIDFHGFTGPFVQYTHARIKSILRKERAAGPDPVPESTTLLPLEKKLIILLEQYSAIIAQAREEHNPSVIAIYVFTLAKTFNTFYTEHSVMNAESEEKKQLRLRLCEMTANVIASAMGILGIRVPERM